MRVIGMIILVWLSLDSLAGKHFVGFHFTHDSEYCAQIIEQSASQKQDLQVLPTPKTKSASSVLFTAGSLLIAICLIVASIRGQREQEFERTAP